MRRPPRNLALVIGVGIAFLLIFAAFNTASQASESVLEGARQEIGPSFIASGYISLAIVYVFCAFFNWISPVVVSFMKLKYAMFVGSMTYVLFLISFFKPMTWLIYLTSAIMGCGAAILWTAHGVFMTSCSTQANLNRNFGIFWTIFQTSTLIGSIYTYFHLSNVTTISSEVRINLYAVFTAVSSLGCVLFLFLPSNLNPNEINEETSASVEIINEEVKSVDSNEVQEMVVPSIVSEFYATDADSPHRTNWRTDLKVVFAQSFRLLKSPQMMGILLATAYTGINQTFFSGVYGTCLSRMEVFGSSAKSYIGLSGVFIGIGELVGSQLTMLSSSRVRPVFIMLVGFVTAILSVGLAFLMVPAEAPVQSTASPTIIQPSVYLAMFIACLFGLNDSIWNTQISSLVGKAYPITAPNSTAAAFALYKFVQSVASACAFFYSTVLFLHWQVLIATVCSVLGIGGFVFAERRTFQSSSSSAIPLESQI